MRDLFKCLLLSGIVLFGLFQTLQAETVTTVNSIHDLKVMSVAAADHKMLVRVKYYGDLAGNEITQNGVPIDDEGGGLFRLDTQTSLSSVVINDGINVAANVIDGEGFWKREFSGMVNVCWFGAKTNGTSDDSAYFQAAIDYVRGVNGSTSSPSLQHQGLGVFVPAGTYYIETTLDLTYSGSAAGTNTQYFGLSLIGADRFQSQLIGLTNASPVIDMTGSMRGQLKDLYISSSTTSSPSCAVLTARNSTSGGAGLHTLEDVNIFGYFTKYAVVMISSECNTFKDVTISNYSQGAGCLFMGQSVPSGISSPYVSTIGTTGGSTRNRFENCYFAEFNSVSGNCIQLTDVDSATFISCYTNCTAGITVLISGPVSNLLMMDIRDESHGSHFMNIVQSATLDNAFITGRTSRDFQGEDLSVIKNSVIRLGFIATINSYAIDFYDMINTEVLGFTTAARVRNSARNSRFLEPRTYKIAPDRSGALDLNNLGDAEAAGLKFTIAYTGGIANYQTHVMGMSTYDRHVFNNVIATAFIHRTKYVWPDDVAQGVTANPFSPLVMTHGPIWVFKLNQSLILNNPGDTWKTIDDPQEGMTLTMVFKQDSIGGRAVAFGSQYVLNGWQVDQAANAISIAKFYMVIIDGSVKLIKI